MSPSQYSGWQVDGVCSPENLPCIIAAIWTITSPNTVDVHSLGLGSARQRRFVWLVDSPQALWVGIWRKKRNHPKGGLCRARFSIRSVWLTGVLTKRLLLPFGLMS